MAANAPPAALDPVLHSGPRIAIVGRLVYHPALRFAALRDATQLTGGNLASHLAVLEKEGYVVQRDAIISLRPGKLVALTDRGREAFRRYVAALEALVSELKAAPATPGELHSSGAAAQKIT